MCAAKKKTKTPHKKTIESLIYTQKTGEKYSIFTPFESMAIQTAVVAPALLVAPYT